MEQHDPTMVPQRWDFRGVIDLLLSWRESIGRKKDRGGKPTTALNEHLIFSRQQMTYLTRVVQPRILHSLQESQGDPNVIMRSSINRIRNMSPADATERDVRMR
ncbi:hypothetical protein B296_00027572 [Ensete ventricosum]|uniref:Uncharacterized protein n=1 Tax=Ensete ventricosum TaxID=4639 RepID=A0A427AJ60_ENSVE|nr:hypothetical protein B296_00027572 [Ensete ventricosum]